MKWLAILGDSTHDCSSQGVSAVLSSVSSVDDTTGTVGDIPPLGLTGPRGTVDVFSVERGAPGGFEGSTRDSNSPAASSTVSAISGVDVAAGIVRGIRPPGKKVTRRRLVNKRVSYN